MVPDTPDNSIIWKPIPGYELGYKISTTGVIWSEHKQELLKQRIANNGYPMVRLYPSARGFLSHRLVAETFIPRPVGKAYINHKNGIKIDNRAENLEWVTAKENTAHGIVTGLISVRGENNAMSKLNAEKVREIRAKYATRERTTHELAADYGVSVATISLVINRLRWKHVE